MKQLIFIVGALLISCGREKYSDMFKLDYAMAKEAAVHKAVIDSIYMPGGSSYDTTAAEMKALRSRITAKLDEDSAKGILLIWPEKK